MSLDANQLKWLTSPETQEILKNVCIGIEKEGLRVQNKDLRLSQADHPQALGSKLTHPYITTDYSEALLELITPANNRNYLPLEFLGHLHRFVTKSLPSEEHLWNASMPPLLGNADSIRIADYGPSNIGQLKTVYRNGLACRYGRHMQTIAGVHFNFSFPPAYWAHAKGHAEINQTEVNESYFGLIRNFRRTYWVLLYLFGASPVCDQSLLPEGTGKLERLSDRTYGYKWATSLRMSEIGYTSDAQDSLQICFNHLDTYVKTLEEAVSTPWSAYQGIPKEIDGIYQQLNPNLLQIENEYYSPIRPKRVTQNNEHPTTALKRRGIEYIEVRCLDIDPYDPNGLSDTALHFMVCYLIYLSLTESPPMLAEECKQAEQWVVTVAEEGRNPNLTLPFGPSKGQTLPDAIIQLLKDLFPIAEALDACHGCDSYVNALNEIQKKAENPADLPSARIMNQIEAHQESWLSIGESLSLIANEHWNKALSSAEKHTSSSFTQHLVHQSKESFALQSRLEADAQLPFETFLHQWLFRP